jgi:hypothetical protein
MSRTALRVKVTNPIAVQMATTTATPPVTARAPPLLPATSITASGGMRPPSLMRFGT